VVQVTVFVELPLTVAVKSCAEHVSMVVGAGDTLTEMLAVSPPAVQAAVRASELAPSASVSQAPEWPSFARVRRSVKRGMGKLIIDPGATMGNKKAGSSA
jgi:hypothetical protein